MELTVPQGEGLKLVDLDGDGRKDVMVNQVWYRNPGSFGDPSLWQAYTNCPSWNWPHAGPEHMIAEVIGPMSLGVADMDRDGDLDVVVGEHNLDHPEAARLIWFENVKGDGSRWAMHMIHTGDEHHNGAHVVDIDNDSDLGIVSIGWGHGRVVICENLSTPNLNHVRQVSS